ncbi:hypothetical protein HQ520_13505, partial [bacterium]|nr:hypothetical protein [bacterium]
MEKIEFRKTRWQSFLDDAADVRRLFLIRYNPDPQPRPLPHPDNIPERIDYALIEYQCQMERMAWLEDDALPYLSPYTGTEIFAEAFGCRVHRSVDTMPFALPCIESASQVAALKVPDLDTPCLSAIFEIAETLKSREGNGALLQLPDIQSPMDIAALIWDK